MHKKYDFQYLIVAAVALLSTLPWLGYLSGDAVIHLIFAEHAAAGNWFVFNNLIPSGGESSPLYLVFVTALYKLAGPEKIPYLLVTCNVLAWLATALLTRRSALLLGISPIVSTLCAISVAAMPGSVRNAVLGMENVYLALGLLVFLNISIPLKYITTPLAPRIELLFGLLLAALACLRTEATILIALFTLARHLNIYKKNGLTLSKHLPALISPLTAASLFLLQLAWYYHATGGQLPFSGGLARQALAAQEAWFHLGPVPFNGKILTRLTLYFPLTLLVLASLFPTPKTSPAKPWFNAFLIAIVGLIPLFATVLPSGHLGRYTIFMWPLFALLAAHGWQNITSLRIRHAAPVGIALFTLLMGIYMAENIMRYKTLSAGHPLAEVAAGPAKRTTYTNEKLATWGLTNRPQVNVAINEVQLRYFVDNRIKIISLDGIVNANLFPISFITASTITSTTSPLKMLTLFWSFPTLTQTSPHGPSPIWKRSSRANTERSAH